MKYHLACRIIFGGEEGEINLFPLRFYACLVTYYTCLFIYLFSELVS